MHLDECASCRDYAQAAEQFVRALRSVPLAADLSLVRSTQMRVRVHAQQLQEKQERLWLVWMSCIVVGLSAAITTPLLWRGFEWIGEWAPCLKSGLASGLHDFLDFARTRRQPDFSGSRDSLDRHERNVARLRMENGELICS